VWALSAGLVPGLHRPGLATASLIGAGLIALLLVVRRAARRFPAVGRACSDAKAGLAVLGSPAYYARRVASWNVLSRALRLASLAAFLAAFGLAVSITAALVVMIAHSSGRLLPFSPASAATSLGLLVAAFPAVTHTTASASQLTAFYLGTTGLLTVVGIALSALVLVRELGLAGARRVAGDALERLRVPRKTPVRVPAA